MQFGELFFFFKGLVNLAVLLFSCMGAHLISLLVPTEAFISSVLLPDLRLNGQKC